MHNIVILDEGKELFDCASALVTSGKLESGISIATSEDLGHAMLEFAPVDFGYLRNAADLEGMTLDNVINTMGLHAHIMDISGVRLFAYNPRLIEPHIRVSDYLNALRLYERKFSPTTARFLAVPDDIPRSGPTAEARLYDLFSRPEGGA